MAAKPCCIVSKVHDDLIDAVAASGSMLCGNCRIELLSVQEILASIIDGEAVPGSLETLAEKAGGIVSEGHCPAATRAVAPVLSSLNEFRAKYEAHALHRNCADSYCRKLMLAPCQLACPAGIDIAGYLALAAQGKYQEALELIREDSPFPWVCGLICPHPCERACVRSHLDLPVNIRYVKAFVAEQAQRKNYSQAVPHRPIEREEVAIIGSGPAGLTAAHYLALAGYRPTIFEALPKAGGLLVYGIPEYRLPRLIVDRELRWVESLGVKIRTGITIGKDLSLDDLRKAGFRAFFMAIGAHRGFKLGISGEDEFAPVYDALSFLKEVNSGSKINPGNRVVVIGGGNSAMDAARTCIRLGSEEVHVAYRRSKAEMPASPKEILEATEEGVNFYFLTVPTAIAGNAGRVTHLECIRSELGEPDASGRRRPVPIEGSKFKIPVDAVIAAIGQEPDLSPFLPNPPCPTSRRSLLLTRPPGTKTDVPDVFAGGDAVTGPATVVRAVAAGKQAAIDIDHYLRGKAGEAELFTFRKRKPREFTSISALEKVSTGRIPMPMADVEKRRQNFEPVELSLSEEQGRIEATRCLRCDVCIRCGECAKVCRDQMKVEALFFGRISTEERMLFDYGLPAERCIGCGACAATCPTGALRITDKDGYRELSMCGTVLNRLELLECAHCGDSFVPDRLMKFVMEKSDSGNKVARNICPVCARTLRAQSMNRFGIADDPGRTG
ncbi:MAG: FAD-dependent oxidoreductase [Syntrophobacteraceae bacterium]